MPPLRLHPAAIRPLVGMVFLLSVGCERNAPPVRSETETSVAAPLAESASVPAVRSGWNVRAGIALLVQGETRDEAIVLLPSETDTSALSRVASASAVLLGRGGAQFTASVGVRATGLDMECRVWPLRDVRGDGSATAWAVGFLGGEVAAIAMDSVEMLSSRDSMALAAEASRLASSVTLETAPSFQGLRFTALDIRRFEVSPGVQALVAHVMRKVNQEANPQEEQTLLIAERDSGVVSGPYQLTYAERTHGLEEQGVTPEAIAAVRLAGRATLVVAHDGDEGVSYSLLERIGPRQWKVRWTSAATRCA